MQKKVNGLDLICVDCVNQLNSLYAIKMSAKMEYENIIFLTDYIDNSIMNEIDEFNQLNETNKINVVYIDKITSIYDYSKFIISELHKYMISDHALMIQSDGYVLNYKIWDDDWLNYDYIGACWWYLDSFNVGNGGFSLRSKKLMKLVSEIITDNFHPEDVVICRDYGKTLRNMGIKFANDNVAELFSYEKNCMYSYPFQETFGFHGKHTFST